MGITVFLFFVAVALLLVAWKQHQNLRTHKRVLRLIMRKLPNKVLRETSNDLLLWTGKLINEHQAEIREAILRGVPRNEIERKEAIVREIKADFYEAYDEQVELIKLLGRNPRDILFDRDWEEYAHAESPYPKVEPSRIH